MNVTGQISGRCPSVMAGLVPVIHAVRPPDSQIIRQKSCIFNILRAGGRARLQHGRVDGRDEPGHDDEGRRPGILPRLLNEPMQYLSTEDLNAKRDFS
jgi:hypothetical protein